MTKHDTINDTMSILSLTREQMYGGREWIKTHKGTQIADTPLWVLISLGILAVQEENEHDS